MALHLIHSSASQVLDLFFVLSWAIWSNRNKLVHNDSPLSPSQVWNLAIYTLEDFKMAASLDILPQDILKIGGRLLLKKFSKLMLMGQLLTLEKIPALE